MHPKVNQTSIQADLFDVPSDQSDGLSRIGWRHSAFGLLAYPARKTTVDSPAIEHSRCEFQQYPVPEDRKRELINFLVSRGKPAFRPLIEALYLAGSDTLALTRRFNPLL